MATVPAAGIIRRPYFSVYRNAAQNITRAAWGKVNFDTETYDPLNWYDNVTNYRATPTLAGSYIIILRISLDALQLADVMYISIYKNGANIAQTKYIMPVAADSVYLTLSTVLYMNGSTDYIEGYTYHDYGTGSDTRPINTGDASTHFSAFYLGPLVG